MLIPAHCHTATVATQSSGAQLHTAAMMPYINHMTQRHTCCPNHITITHDCTQGLLLVAAAHRTMHVIRSGSAAVRSSLVMLLLLLLSRLSRFRAALRTLPEALRHSLSAPVAYTQWAT